MILPLQLPETPVALAMAGQLSIPVLGLIENMSYVRCPGCDAHPANSVPS